MIPSVNLRVLLVCKPMITWSLLDEAFLPFFNGCDLSAFANMIMHLTPVYCFAGYELHPLKFQGNLCAIFPSKPFSWKQYVDAALSQSNCWKLTKNSYNLLLDLLQGKIYIFTCKLATSLWYYCWKHNVNKLPSQTLAA